MKVKAILISLFVGLQLLCYSQDWKLLKSVPLKETTTFQSMDSEGSIYLGTNDGNIHRYDKEGELLEVYADIAKFPVTLVEAWNRLKPFLFYRGSQQLYFLNRFNTTPITYDISDFYAGLARLVTPGMDNSIWILTTDFNELKKYNLQSKQLLLDNPLSQNLNDATYMRAYKNQLLIADANNGLYYFDQFGNELYHDKTFKSSAFQIVNNQLIYLEGDLIKTIDLIRRTVQAKIAAPGADLINVLKYEDQYYFMKPNELLIYELNE